jgi:hypothetical protein
MSLFPGEAEAIETVKRLGAQFGYGNLIHHLKDAWSESLQKQNAIFDKQTADRAAGHVCAWCKVDGRTGKKVKG